MCATGDAIVVQPDGDFRLERDPGSLGAWLELRPDHLLTEITPEGRYRKVYAHGAHLIPRSLFEEAAHFRSPGELAAWLNEPCRALRHRVPRFLLEEGDQFLSGVKVALRQTKAPANGSTVAIRPNL
jgi:hypothetical protein